MTKNDRKDPFLDGSSRKPARKFLERNGFYIVLFICLGIIGVTAIITGLDRTQLAMDEPAPTEQVGWLNTPEPYIPPTVAPTITPAQTPVIARTEVPAITATPAPTPEVTATPKVAQGQPNTEKTVPDPLEGMIRPTSGELLMGFANKSLLYNETLNQWGTHLGVDLAANEGEDVLAALDGTVVSVTSNGLMGYMVVIKHSDTLQSVYASLGEAKLPKVGAQVSAGDVIGTASNNASSEKFLGPHVHFEVHMNDKPLDPTKYISKTEDQA